MTRLKWKDEYSVGDGEIDRQHQNLFSLIDRLEDHDLDASALAITFDKLDLYVGEHFADEEEKLIACNYDDLDAHIRQHNEFRDWLNTAKESFKSANEANMSIGSNVHDFLRDWLLSHILTADQAYKDWINK
ncbi:putative Hemerythrin-like metal-binding domain-containing protein [Candidatus Terasakiella magnetica]|uniref:Putative Hemerythrin-like metal-binding domain-containing protein n=1 Tax=Candidatus Terasakiella magnetica TaxID=1867952 RepID=A0A1C3REQ7_9PROT|nr:bacteriohemerythrin [Candidatus Terasakiella magnetica]SCA55739.1 putative Hemerythrin-like metal-binding domain-containing protein [Candidatus Terasakiella magnetica]